jgi:hypothetical protein
VIDDELLREYADAVRSDVTAPPLAAVRAGARRRQRLHVAAGALAVAVVTAGVVVPIALLHNGSSGDRRAQVVVTSPSPTPSASTKYPLPALGAPGFPASVYPLAHRGAKPGTIASCPSNSGLQPPNDVARRQALRTAQRLETRSFASDLHDTDRSYWPGIQAGWQAHRNWQTPAAPRKRSRVYLLYSGRLSGLEQPTGVPNLAPYVGEGCGERTLRDTFIAIYGPARSQDQASGLQNADLFVVRHGRALLYFSYP